MTLDAKGRISLPARHRALLADLPDHSLTLTRHPDGCLLLYPAEEWEQRRRALLRLPYGARDLQRLVLGSAETVVPDSSGRLLIPAGLRALCGIGREAALVGLGTHLELWDAAALARREAELLEKGLGGIDFSF